MNVTELVTEIEGSVARLPDQKASTLRALRREYSRRMKSMAAEEVLAAAEALVERRRVHRFFGEELIAGHPGAFALLNRKRLERLGAGMSSWDQVDCFACILAGAAWREGLVGDAVIACWAKSKDRWWRRAALVSTVPLNVKAQGGAGDARRTLSVCELLLDDRDEMVVKALSWALRALAVRDAEAVRRFVAEHEERLAALVRREVGNKLATGRKNPQA